MPLTHSKEVLHPEDIPLGLPAGRRPGIRVLVPNGTVNADSVRVVSKRLIFFSLAVPSTEKSMASTTVLWECLAKWRDGCLDEAEIAQLLAVLTANPTTRLSLQCFPEMADDGSVASLHVIQVSLLLPPDQIGGGEVPQQIPATAREPEPEAEGGSSSSAASLDKAPIHKNQRHQQFVAWLVDTYGLDYLRSGSGVLDVAGGAGGIAFELAFRRGIPCVVVDPRPMKLNARQRRALKNRVNSQAVLAANPPSKNASWWLAGATAHTAATTTPPPASETASAPAQAQAVSMDLATECEPESMGGLMEVCSEVSQGGSAHEARTEEALTTPRVPASYADAWDEEGLPTSCLPRQVLGYFDSAFVTSPGTREVWEDCSIVVGMHPDEATEPIVRAARAAGKPFAVVPCCVFAKAHPERRLPNGRHVESHEEFCEYLEGLDDATGSGEPRAERQHQREGEQAHAAPGAGVAAAGGAYAYAHRTATLGFVGRNIVVYSEPKVDVVPAS